MSLFDVFKRKKKEEAKSEEKPVKEKVEEKVEEKKEAKPVKKAVKAKKVEDAFPYMVIDHQHITEKAGDLMALNKYTFRVFDRVNKDMVCKAVEKLYGVKVKSVNIMNVPSKAMRLGRFEGTKGGYKKAIVTLQEGHKIELSPH
jgi:large subunit ribosomal protein L23